LEKGNGVRHLLARWSEGCRGQRPEFHFFQRNADFLVFFSAFPALPSTQKKTQKTQKKSTNTRKHKTKHNSHHKNNKKIVIPQKNHKSYDKKKKKT